MPDWKLKINKDYGVIIHGPGKLRISMLGFDLDKLKQGSSQGDKSRVYRHWAYPLNGDTELYLCSAAFPLESGKPPVHNLEIGDYLWWEVPAYFAESLHDIAKQINKEYPYQD